MGSNGKVAIVTGASSGIGNAVARAFAREGMKLVVTGRKAEELAALVREIQDDGGEAVATVGDVRDEATAKASVRLAQERFGGLDIAVNNAEVLGEMARTDQISTQGWRETIDVNLTGCFLGAKHQIPAMIERGGGS